METEAIEAQAGAMTYSWKPLFSWYKCADSELNHMNFREKVASLRWTVVVPEIGILVTMTIYVIMSVVRLVS